MRWLVAVIGLSGAPVAAQGLIEMSEPMEQCLEQARLTGDFMPCVSLFAEPCRQIYPDLLLSCHTNQMYFWKAEVRYWEFDVERLAEEVDQREELADGQGVAEAFQIVRDQWAENRLATCLVLDLATRSRGPSTADLEFCIEREHARYVESLYHLSRAIR